MKFSPFSCPIFLGHPEARGRCSQGERVLYGRDLCRSGGAGKAEHAKLRGAGIGPKQCPGKCAEKKDSLLKSVRVARKSTVAETGRVKRCEGALYRRLREHSGETKQCLMVGEQRVMN
jgi:hypothetical protein